MHCPYCDHTDSRVLESRATGAGRSIRRRRECLNCKHRFTTYERIEFVPISVVKRNGQSEAFDRTKLIRGMARACEKTSVAPATIEAITEAIETQLQQSPKRSISTDKIGELVLHRLRQESEVAYVRFASVYRNFQDVADFIQTLNHLQETADEADQWLQSKTGDSNKAAKKNSDNSQSVLAAQASK